MISAAENEISKTHDALVDRLIDELEREPSAVLSNLIECYGDARSAGGFENGLKDADSSQATEDLRNDAYSDGRDSGHADGLSQGKDEGSAEAFASVLEACAPGSDGELYILRRVAGDHVQTLEFADWSNPTPGDIAIVHHGAGRLVVRRENNCPDALADHSFITTRETP